MRAIKLVSVAFATSCIAMAATAQTNMDRSFKTVSKDCSGIQWSAEAIRQYPTIASACQGVEDRNGKTYVKFEGRVAQNIDNGKQLKVDFKDGGQMTLTPPSDMTVGVYVDGQKRGLKDLRRGDRLSFYVAEDRFAAQIPEEETATARLVIVPIMYREVVREETPERTAAVLPATATNLPLLAMVGLALVALGAAMTVIRRRR